MAKVYGVQEIELRPDVTEAEFERYFREEIGTIERVFPGFKMCLAKSDRGARNGKYAIVIEIESVEARNRMNPMPDVVSEEAQRLLEETGMALALAKWDQYASTITGESRSYDYVVVCEGPH